MKKHFQYMGGKDKVFGNFYFVVNIKYKQR